MQVCIEQDRYKYLTKKSSIMQRSCFYSYVYISVAAAAEDFDCGISILMGSVHKNAYLCSTVKIFFNF